MRRYQIDYSFDARRKRSTIRGFCEKLPAACASAVRHIARAEFDGREYHAAVISDRRAGVFLRKYYLNRETGTIVCQDLTRKEG